MKLKRKIQRETGAALCEYLLLMVSVIVISIPAARAVGNAGSASLVQVTDALSSGGESNGSHILSKKKPSKQKPAFPPGSWHK